MTLCEAFQDTVNRYGDKTALDVGDQQLTYQDLDVRSGMLASAIRDTNVSSEWVPVLVSDPVDQILAIWSILRAGRGWVFLEPSYPAAHLKRIIEDCGASVIVVDKAGQEKLSDTDTLVFLDVTARANLSGQPEPELVTESDFACMLYTSGSTGNPKGVVHTHRSLLHVARKSIQSCDFGPSDNIAMLSPLSHVVGVAAMLLSFISGATLHPMSVAGLGIPAIAERLRRKHVTYFHTVPTVFRKLVRHLNGNELPDLKIMAIGGERVDLQDVLLFRSCTSRNACIRNLYGATEAIDSLEFRLGNSQPVEEALPIGGPCSSSEVVRIDESVTEEAGVGELMIASDFLSLGYWQDPELTREKFPHIDGMRWYRTGDLVSRDQANQLVLVGRVDDLVKIHGQRLSLRAVESAILVLDDVREAAVVCIPDEMSGDNQLKAFVVGDVDTQIVKAHLEANYPAYYVPMHIEQLNELPQLASGKVDYKQLASGSREKLSEGFFDVEWVPLDEKPFDVIGVSLLIRNEKDSFADAIERLFRQHQIHLAVVTVGQKSSMVSAERIDVRPGQVPDLEEFLDGFKAKHGDINHIIDAQNVVGDPTSENLESIFESARLTQNFALALFYRPKVTIVTRNAQLVGNQASVNALSAIRWGIGRTLPREDPRLKLALVDIEDDTDTGSLLVAIAEPEDQLVIRNDSIFAARLTAVNSKIRDKLEVPEGSVFLITGGMGDLGFALAEHLIKIGVGFIYLVGRRQPGVVEENRAAEIQGGSEQICMLSADVSSTEDVQRVVARIAEDGRQLTGVIHAAGTADFSLFRDQGWDTFRRVLAPKVLGAWNLHNATAHLPIRYFYLISSITSLLGFVGHADYCAANAYLDAFALARRHKGLPAGSIRLGTLAGGMANKAEIQHWMSREGLSPIMVPDAAESLRGLTSDRPVVAYLSANLDKLAAVRQKLGGGRLFERVARLGPVEQSVEIRDKAQVEKILDEIFSGILNRKIDRSENFFAAGGDSLGLVELHLSLTERLSIDIPIGTVADNASIDELVVLLESGLSSTERSKVVSVRPTGNRTPIVALNHVRGAHMLKRYTDEDQSLWHLNIFDFIDRFEGRFEEDNIAELGQYFAQSIIEMGFEEVKLLAFCQSGLLAIETTRHLEAEGVRVKLYLLDVLLRMDEIEQKGKLAFWRNRLANISFRDLIRNLRIRWERDRVRVRESLPSNHQAFWDTYIVEAFSSHPEPIQSPVELMYTVDWVYRDRSLIQSVVGEDVPVHVLGAFHNNSFYPPYVERVACILSKSV